MMLTCRWTKVFNPELSWRRVENNNNIKQQTPDSNVVVRIVEEIYVKLFGPMIVRLTDYLTQSGRLNLCYFFLLQTQDNFLLCIYIIPRGIIEGAVPVSTVCPPRDRWLWYFGIK